MKFISLIGYSGSGKTHLITTSIKRLKSELDLSIIVLKNVHNHKVDADGKDSSTFSNAGADFSLIKNKNNEIAIFFKRNLSLDELVDWISKISESIDLIFIEGFRNLNVPGILCVENFKDIKPQLNPNIKMISGLISTKKEIINEIHDIPIINIENEFQRFLEIFGIN